MIVGAWVYFEFNSPDAKLGIQVLTAAGVVLAVRRVLVEHWKTLVSYVKRGETADLHRPLGQLTIAATGAALVGMMQVKANTTPSTSNDFQFSHSLLPTVCVITTEASPKSWCR